MEQKTRRWILISGALATATIVGVAGVLLFSSNGNSSPAGSTERPKPTQQAATAADVARLFVQNIFTEPTAAAQYTDAPDAALKALSATKSQMGASAYQASLSPQSDGNATTADFPASVTWSLPGNATLKYEVKVSLQRTADEWKIHWSPTLIHPQLTEGASLAYRVALADGALLGRDGKPLVQGTIPDGLYKTITGQTGDVKGTDGWEVGITNGTAFTQLDGKKPESGEKITVTIDPARQTAAQAAVDALPQGAAIVAIEASTSEILAVAQNKALSGTNPFVGRYAPGSTMKIVTAAAALNAGLTQPNTALPCPATATIGTRTIKNADFGYDSLPFHTAFAVSCNTTFGSLGSKLPPTPSRTWPSASAWGPTGPSPAPTPTRAKSPQPPATNRWKTASAKATW